LVNEDTALLRLIFGHIKHRAAWRNSGMTWWKKLMIIVTQFFRYRFQAGIAGIEGGKEGKRER